MTIAAACAAIDRLQQQVATLTVERDTWRARAETR